MTAIGFLLLVVGAIFISFGRDYFDRLNAAGYLGVALVLMGALMLVVGVVLWLWRVMP